MCLVSWNCRGLGTHMKIEAVKDLLKIKPSDILMLQETKIEGQALLDISKVKWKKNAGNEDLRGASYPMDRRSLPPKQLLQNSALDLHKIKALCKDLNIVLKPKEKRGGNNNRDHLLPFVEDLIQRWDLLDFSPIRGLYTWTNNKTGEEHISARLERFLVQSSLMMNNKIINTKFLPKLTSDHKPMQLLLEDEEDLGPLPFRFSPLWIERDGFMEQ
eukprot:PITA_16420